MRHFLTVSALILAAALNGCGSASEAANPQDCESITVVPGDSPVGLLEASGMTQGKIKGSDGTMVFLQDGSGAVSFRGLSVGEVVQLCDA